MKNSPLILASQSSARAHLLERLGLSFAKLSPAVNEDELKLNLSHLPPRELALRLAQAKVESVAAENPGAIVIGGDQLVALGEQILGKPLTQANARRQLQLLSGQNHQLITASTLAVAGRPMLSDVNVSRLQMRKLTAEQIAHYVERDQPLQCAGAYRFESLGIALFSQIEMSDNTAIEGLSLVFVVSALAKLGVDVLSNVASL